MTKRIHIPVNKLSVGDAIHKINEVVAGKSIKAIFFNSNSLLKGEIEILVDNSPNVVFKEKPSKFKQNASSKFYCVYKKGNGWTYKFVNKKISKKPFLGKMFDDELDAALAYDKHRFSVEGDLSKLNFPEHYTEVANG